MSSEEVEVIYQQEERPENAEIMGTVKVNSSDYLMYCGITEALAYAKARAAERGGNAIYVTTLRPPGSAPCYRIEAEIYKLQEPYVSKRIAGLAADYFTSSFEGGPTTETLPLFPGGEKEMFDFISRNLIYPATAARDKIKGKVKVSFVVSATGKVKDIHLLEGIRYDIDQEVERVISKMPEFVPGYQNGRAVPVRYTIPFTVSY